MHGRWQEQERTYVLTSAVSTLIKKHVKNMDNYQYHIFSPYRVCPLGAHVDHQHGLVTGFAINKGVDLWFNVREDAMVKLSSLSFEGTVEFDLAKRTEVREKHWGDYARGAKYALKKRFELTHGIEGVIKGSLPVGGLVILYLAGFKCWPAVRNEILSTSRISEAQLKFLRLMMIGFSPILVLIVLISGLI